MSQDMPTWKYIPSLSKLSAVRGVFNHPGIATPLSRAADAVGATHEQRQSWRAWASQKIRGNPGGQGNSNKEILTLFPGWATRRYANNLVHRGDEPTPFEVEVFVSGYAISCRAQNQSSRSQRAFIRLAKGFAALPRISDQVSTATSLTAEELFNQDNGPNALPDDYHAQVLDKHLQRARADSISDSDSDSSENDPSPSHIPSSYPFQTLPPKELNTPVDVLQKLHYNLETRLQLFWSSTLASRTIRLHLFTSPHHDTNDHRPLATQDVTTGADGSFSTKFHVKWDDLCHHPEALHIAFGEPIQEHDLVVVAELLPPVVASCSTSSLANPRSVSASHPHPPSHPHLRDLFSTLSSLSNFVSFLSPSATASAHVGIPITHCPVRVISDVDDTVKMSGVPDGARAVFHNVFVRELKESVIPGMGEWYSNMWERGVRFHYVSNGPYAYLSVLQEFFEISKLPPGSIKLKSYAGRSLLRGLLSTPATRKRAGVVDILDSFPDAGFILIGDSGEQDLELYADLARERPNQIRAIFIRDAEELCYDPIDDPTGWNVVGAGAAGTRPGSEPLLDYSSPASSISSSLARDTTLKEDDVHATPKAFSTKGLPDVDDVGGRYTSTPLHEEPVDWYTPESTNGLEGDTPKPRHAPAFADPPPPPPPATSKIPCQSQHQNSTSNSMLFPPPTSRSYDQFITSPPLPVPPPNINSFARSGTAVRSATDSIVPPHLSGHHTIPKSRSRRIAESIRSGVSSSSSSSSSSSTSRKSNSYSRPGTVPSGMAVRSGSIGLSGSESGNGSGSWSSGSWSGSRLTEGEKKRAELQMRVDRARTQMPGKVHLRVFRDPGECEEDVDEILQGV